MHFLAKTLFIEIAATVVGTAIWEGYKSYCRLCWKKLCKTNEK
jgi:hypothetical protein